MAKCYSVGGPNEVSALASHPDDIGIRYRSQSGMRALDRSQLGAHLFGPSEAKHDRIKFAMSVLIDLGSYDPQTYAELVTNLDTSGPDVLRLRPGPGPSYQPFYWQLSTNKADWLFNLHGKLRQDSQSLTGSAFLELNPTRFLAHRVDDNTAEEAWASLPRRPERQSFLQGNSLDQSDNWLDGPTRNGGTIFGHRAQWWRSILEQYFCQVEEVVRASLAPEGHALSFNASLRQFEVYWELETRQANTVIREIGNRLRQADSHAQIVGTRSDIAGTENAEWVRLKLTATINLKIYAKTQDRIRFEIARNKDIDQSTANEVGSNLWLPDYALFNLLEDSSARLSNVWNEIRHHIQLSSNAPLFFEWCAKITSVIPEPRSSACLQALIESGRIAATSGSEIASNSELRTLVDRGALTRFRTRNRSRMYTVAPQYRSAVASVAAHFYPNV